ncbi:hypothetical protein F8388_016462 [Cannabis sativa]|uniref:CCHC-type domain-containing protein n=1 Tax=Cannabis sativa TaxID=3483 RepID=A0A7J6F0R1_CANSA|nr:hypothetical protein G4B88_016213 [Cannabis sativa]KAF4386210.1 hypothetical protein F8388_016462 [Cannabis sativa]
MAVMATEVEVDDLVTLTNKLAVESEEDWEVNEEDATVGTWKVKILEVHKDHTFVKISFKNCDNIRMVLDKQPWLFGRGLLVMEEWPLFDQWVDAKLDMVCCWVRIRGVPLKLCTQANIERVAKFGGEVEEVCWSNSHQVLFNGYVYMRIGFPINRGIFVGQFVKLAGVDYWVHFKFEKLFVLCFHCGYWGHEKKDCEKEKIMKEGKDRRWVPRYGEWLKEDSPIPNFFVGQSVVEGGRSDGIWREVDDRGEAVRDRGHMTQLPTVTKDGNENVRPKDHLGNQGNGPIVIFGENVTCVDNGLTTERRTQAAFLSMWNIRKEKFRFRGLVFTSNGIEENDGRYEGDDANEGEQKKKKNGGKDRNVEEKGETSSMGRLANSGQKRKASIKNWARNLANRRTKKVQGTSLNSATMVRNYSGLDAFEKEWGGANFVFRVGLSGRLLLMWRDDVQVQVLASSPGHILCTVVGQGFLPWMLTYFYGEMMCKCKFWQVLLDIFYGHWLCMGDFNEITSLSKKVGGRSRSPRAMDEFKEVIDDCRFIGFSSSKHDLTWCNEHANLRVMK